MFEFSRRPWVAGIAVSSLLAFTGVAAAQTPKDEAKRHFDAGVALAKSEDFPAAAAEFESSVAAFATKMGLFNLANAYKALHRYGDALAAIERLEREFGKTLGADLEREVTAFKSTVQAIVGRLDVRVDREGASIRIDGADAGTSPLPNPLIVAPGDRVIEVSLDGFETAQRTVKISSGDTVVTEIVLVPVREAPPVPAVVEADNGAPSADDGASKAPGEGSGDVKRKGVGALFWVSLGGTIVTGALSGVFYGLAAGASKDFDGYKSDYGTVLDDYAANPNDPALASREAKLWGRMDDAATDMEKFGKLGLGFGIAAGALAVTTVIVGVVQTRAGGNPDVEVAATPGGVSLSF